jgi:hypothetical protein
LPRGGWHSHRIQDEGVGKALLSVPAVQTDAEIPKAMPFKGPGNLKVYLGQSTATDYTHADSCFSLRKDFLVLFISYVLNSMPSKAERPRTYSIIRISFSVIAHCRTLKACGY